MFTCCHHLPIPSAPVATTYPDLQPQWPPLTHTFSPSGHHLPIPSAPVATTYPYLQPRWPPLTHTFSPSQFNSHPILFLLRLILTLCLLTWRIWWARNNGSKGQMGFNSLFKELILSFHLHIGFQCFFLSCFPTKTPYSFLFSHKVSHCPSINPCMTFSVCINCEADCCTAAR